MVILFGAGYPKKDKDLNDDYSKKQSKKSEQFKATELKSSPQVVSHALVLVPYRSIEESRHVRCKSCAASRALSVLNIEKLVCRDYLFDHDMRRSSSHDHEPFRLLKYDKNCQRVILEASKTTLPEKYWADWFRNYDPEFWARYGPKLTRLILVSCRIYIEDFFEMLNKCSKLESLELFHCNLVFRDEKNFERSTPRKIKIGSPLMQTLRSVLLKKSSDDEKCKPHGPLIEQLLLRCPNLKKVWSEYLEADDLNGNGDHLDLLSRPKKSYLDGAAQIVLFFDKQTSYPEKMVPARWLLEIPGIKLRRLTTDVKNTALFHSVTQMRITRTLRGSLFRGEEVIELKSHPKEPEGRRIFAKVENGKIFAKVVNENGSYVDVEIGPHKTNPKVGFYFRVF